MTYGFAFAYAVLDVALEYDTIGFREAESFVAALQGTADLPESREDVGIHGATEKETHGARIHLRTSEQSYFDR